MSKPKQKAKNTQVDDVFNDLFSIFDTDEDGIIKKQEALKVAKGMGYQVSMNDIESIINSSNALDDKTKIKKQDLFNGLKDLNSISDEELNEVKEAFGFFDYNKDGKISMKEFKYILLKLGEELNEEQVEEIFNTIDADKDGYLDYNEFVNTWKYQ
jgi:Ca2+-binding EF-hand superfamily protein